MKNKLKKPTATDTNPKQELQRILEKIIIGVSGPEVIKDSIEFGYWLGVCCGATAVFLFYLAVKAL